MVEITNGKTLLLSYSIIVLLFHATANPPPFEGDPKPPTRDVIHQVRITNEIGPNTPALKFRCQSRDNDLGYQTLGFRQSYHFQFKINFWWTTLFFCHFYYNGRQQVFEVFHAGSETCENYVSGGYNVCSWIVKGDGFYTVGKEPWTDKDLVKKYEWR